MNFTRATVHRVPSSWTLRLGFCSRYSPDCHLFGNDIFHQKKTSVSFEPVHFPFDLIDFAPSVARGMTNTCLWLALEKHKMLLLSLDLNTPIYLILWRGNLQNKWLEYDLMASHELTIVPTVVLWCPGSRYTIIIESIASLCLRQEWVSNSSSQMAGADGSGTTPTWLDYPYKVPEIMG